MKRAVLSALVVVAALSMVGPAAQAAGTSGNFILISNDDHGRAPNGDVVLVTGTGTFSVHPDSVVATGTFTHSNAAGAVLGSGTWTATELVSFSFYGCRFVPAEGLDLGDDNLCGGALKLMVVLHTPLGEFPAVLTIFCIIGLNAPASHNTLDEEGVTLNIPGVINFNHAVGGDNVFVRVS